MERTGVGIDVNLTVPKAHHAIALRAVQACRRLIDDGAIAFHVLDVMHAFHDASDRGRRVAVRSRCERPAAMPTGLEPRAID